MSLYKLMGFAPDMDRTTPGVVTDCEHLVPSIRGMEGAPSLAATGLATVVGTATASAVMRKLDYTSRFFVGTSTDIYEAISATAWTNVGSSLGAATIDFPWRFTQFGDTSLAINPAQTLVASGAAGTAFTAITGGPMGAIIETVNQFVFALDTDLGDDYWQCSALGLYNSWAASVSSQAATGRLTSSPGRITAGRRLGDNIVVYKRTAMYVGQYVGSADNTFAFQEIPGEIGAPSQEAVVSVGYAHYFLDGNYQNFYAFDGSRPVPIGERLREWFYDRLDKQYANRIKALHDRMNNRIYWYFPVIGGGGALTAAIVLNYKTMQWGCDDQDIYVPVEYIAAATSLDGLATLYSTYDNLPTMSYDAPFWNSGAPVPAVVTNTNMVRTLTGQATTGGFTTGDIGNDKDYILLRGVKPRYLTKPTAGAMTNYYAADLGDTFSTDAVTVESSSSYDVLRSARWHRLQFEFTGPVELNALEVDVVQEGEE